MTVMRVAADKLYTVAFGLARRLWRTKQAPQEFAGVKTAVVVLWKRKKAAGKRPALIMMLRATIAVKVAAVAKAAEALCQREYNI